MKNSQFNAVIGLLNINLAVSAGIHSIFGKVFVMLGLGYILVGVGYYFMELRKK